MHCENECTGLRIRAHYYGRSVSGTSVGAGSAELEEGRRRKEEFQIMDVFASKKEGPIVQFRKRK